MCLYNKNQTHKNNKLEIDVIKILNTVAILVIGLCIIFIVDICCKNVLEKLVVGFLGIIISSSNKELIEGGLIIGLYFLGNG